MVNKALHITLLLIVCIFAQQCKVSKIIVKEARIQKRGLEGYQDLCQQADTIESVLIRKAEAIIDYQDDRYETTLTLYNLIDSFIYVSAVSSGIEIFRGTIDRDSITFIDRIHKIVYKSAVKKRFGYQHPATYDELEMLISKFGCCNELPLIQELSDEQLFIDISEGYITKRVYLDMNEFTLQKFEFFHTKTNDYIIGERIDNTGLRFASNFIVNDFEIKTSGGELTYNRRVDISMDVNKRKYSFIEFQ